MSGPRHHYFDRRRIDREKFFRRLVTTLFLVVGVPLILLLAAFFVGRQSVDGSRLVPLTLLALAPLYLTYRTYRVFAGTIKQLNAAMGAADRVADGDYEVRLEETGQPAFRAMQRSFNRMTERLQNADRLRRELMADVAHELRTPLTVLQGKLEGLRDGLYPRDDAQVSQLLEETHVLSRLVEDLRTLALSEAGALPLQKESTEVSDIVADAAASLRDQAVTASVVLDVVPANAAATLELDPLRIREVLTNLLSNAIRHTPPGGHVTVSTGVTADAVTVAVSDTGEGLSPEDVARMFDRFYKGPSSRGSGLGLTIARNIVAAHGGEIRASSEKGQGTTVTFILPR